jgi:triacylglycerol lipase
LRALPAALVALALLALVAVGALLWLALRRRARRARPPRRPARLRHPVVLAHGLFGFDEIRLGRARHAYFRGVPARLERSGVDVRLARVAKVGSIETRGEDLADQIRAAGAERVNVVAHSMGGLDARYAISRLGLAERVASLTTVGTPHHGTPIADLGAGLGKWFGLGRALEAMGVPLEALRDLSVEAMAAFNRRVPDAPGVAYGSVVGVVRKKRHTNPLLLPGYLYLADRVGENDGMVPASSQEWGEVLFRIEADHWAQIGWSRHFDALEFYAMLLRELRGRGF